MFRYLRKSSSSLLLRRSFSALYLTGDKACENFAVLSPYLEFEERLKNFDEICENIGRRKLRFNLNDFKDEYELFNSIKHRKNAIEKRRAEIANQIRENPSQADGLKIQGAQLRDDLKCLKENSYHLEDSFVHNYLSLPNFIHENTPSEGKQIIYSFKDTQRDLKPNTSQIEEFIEFYDPTCYYMKDEAAKFDVFMPMQVLTQYISSGFINFSNSDFIKSVIAEGAAVDLKDIFLLKEDETGNKANLLHLSGSSSFLNYLPFVTKLTVFPSLLPLKFICTGKQYDARSNYQHQDLYNVVQSTCCQSFIAAVDGSSFNTLVCEQVEHFVKTFKEFDEHFRIVYYPADELKLAESCRVGVEMFSPSCNAYIEVGNFSYYSDFISKRLLFNYKIGKEFGFPHIYSGTVVNVMKLLLILLENRINFKCPNWLN